MLSLCSSVRPSVRPFVTRRRFTKMAKRSLTSRQMKRLAAATKVTPTVSRQTVTRLSNKIHAASFKSVCGQSRQSGCCQCRVESSHPQRTLQTRSSETASPYHHRAESRSDRSKLGEESCRFPLVLLKPQCREAVWKQKIRSDSYRRPYNEIRVACS